MTILTADDYGLERGKVMEPAEGGAGWKMMKKREIPDERALQSSTRCRSYEEEGDLPKTCFHGASYIIHEQGLRRVFTDLFTFLMLLSPYETPVEEVDTERCTSFKYGV
ncbi:hypothetical protein L2E82_45126 [Cichorium intybus]|uniref:Uncharacterized protein n=1 Tax=Cichorium intybus TaxID=13427 RepID=A0ACB8ZT35_CICIN|nr:hypothetical protein L2E82_45126 [Cichorium intybus]